MDELDPPILFHLKSVILQIKSKKMEAPKTYSDAFEELQTIVKKMENAEISVDELSIMIQRASFLIKICKDKLTKTEVEVSKLLESF